MFKWIEGLVIGAGSKVSSDVPQEGANLLVERLAGLNKLANVSAGLSGRMLAYVFEGEPTSVLNEVSGNPGVSNYLRLTGYHYSRGNSEWAEFYRYFDLMPAAVMLRWAKLLDASVRHSTQQLYVLSLPNGVHWPEALLWHAGGDSLDGGSSQRPFVKHLSAAGIERLLIADGLPEAALLLAAFNGPMFTRYGAEQRAQAVADLNGFGEAAVRHREQIKPLLLQPAVTQRMHVLYLLEKLSAVELSHFAVELAELSVSSSKQVRAAAEPLVMQCGASIQAELIRLAKEAKPEQRLNALRLLWRLAQSTNDELLSVQIRDLAAADKAPSVQALVSEWHENSQNRVADSVRYEYTDPVINWNDALTPAVKDLLTELWSTINHSIEKSNKQALSYYEEQKKQGNKNIQLRQLPIIESSELRSLCDYIASENPQSESPCSRPRDFNWSHVQPALFLLAKSSEITPVVLVKTMAFFDLLIQSDSTLSRAASNIINAQQEATGRPSLLELAHMLESMGYGHQTVFNAYCQNWSPLADRWPAENVWPFFAHYLDTLIQAFNPSKTKDYYFDRSALYRAVASLPIPPDAAVNAMFDLALGTGKSDRPLAQEALNKLPGKEARIINALTDGKAEVRAVSAQWLGRLRYAPAITMLEEAVRKEKNDVAKGAMLDTLQLLGQPVERYLDRDALAKEAKKSLAKGLPKDLEWFSLQALPTVRWQDNNSLVEHDVLIWLLAQAVKQKSPEPNAIVRKYCAMFVPRDREAFGQFVLESWLAEDIKPISAEEAMKRASSQAQTVHGYMSRSPQYYQDDPNLGRSVEELTAIYLPGYLRQPAGSAIASKGLLAVAAACAAERAAAPVARFLKEYYGTRAAQGKALIAMLAWIEHSSATQLMLSVGNRFRTKSFQEEATRQAEALAERKGWTLAELSDRTIPSAGFDETGVQDLSYGQRIFRAKLMPDFKIEIFNPDGKKISALPEPRQDDDAELARDAKKAFSAAKKEIKTIVDLQSERLYEALCTERNWSFEDWSRYLNQHPVMRRLLQRLVWTARDDDVVVATFRPLDDGTLTDCDDNEIHLPDTAQIRISHDSNLPHELVEKWQQHLVDYEISSLFQQFGKGIYTLPATKQNEQLITDFEGHMIEAFTLRGRALKLGYTRGAAEDGGWFHVYEKRFPTLGLIAVLEFTGNPLPEENRLVALLNMSFVSAQNDSWQRNAHRLASVPKVLLSECYNDLRLIAADGAGFDPDWRKKSEY